MSFMSPGGVVWFEIGTADPKAVQAFHRPALGWTFEVDPDSSTDGRTYTRIMAPGARWPMGAIYHGEAGGESINLSVYSTDIAADVEKLKVLGATVIVPATAVGDVTVFNPGGADYAMPSILSEDVPAATGKAMSLGATVEDGPDTNTDGLVYARRKDPHGNRFGLFSCSTPTQHP